MRKSVIITRQEAKTRGLKRFFTGVPCKRGHLSERWVAGYGGCIQCGRESTIAWEKSNPEKAATGAKRRQARRPKRKPNLESGRRWYAKNKAKRYVSIMAWRGAHPETLRSIKHKYRAKRAVGGQYTADDVRELMKLQKRKCAHPWCRKSLAEVYHVDHRIPLALGGSNDRTNIQLLCPSCNHKKQAKHPVDYAKQNGFLV